MDYRQRVYFTTYAVAAGFETGMLLTASIAIPVFWYYPVAHTWAWVTQPQGLAMDWYGRNLVSLTIAVVAGLATWMLTSRIRAPRTVMGVQMIAIWTTIIAAFTAGLYVSQLAPRHARPEPLPSGYVPR
jgi:hypothetical protein